MASSAGAPEYDATHDQDKIAPLKSEAADSDSNILVNGGEHDTFTNGRNPKRRRLERRPTLFSVEHVSESWRRKACLTLGLRSALYFPNRANT